MQDAKKLTDSEGVRQKVRDGYGQIAQEGSERRGGGKRCGGAPLQRDLRRARIELWACEVPFIKEIVAGLSRRTARVPWLTDEPVGLAKLHQLFEPSWS